MGQARRGTRLRVASRRPTIAIAFISGGPALAELACHPTTNYREATSERGGSAAHCSALRMSFCV